MLKQRHAWLLAKSALSEATGRLCGRNISLAQAGFEVAPEFRVVFEEPVDQVVLLF